MIHLPARDSDGSRPARPAAGTGGSRLSRRDLLRVGSLGLRSRRVRATLSALGISIGIAAIVGVLGISQSSKTGLLNELGQLGNLISVQAQNTGLGQPAELPVTAEGMVSRIGPVTSATAIGSIANVYVYRNPLVPASDTSGISLTATDAALPATLGASLAHGAFLNAATARYPAVVLGAETASLLGINDLVHPTQLWIGGHWFTVVGILNPVRLISQMDSMAFIGFPVAEQYFGFDGHPTGLYLRSVPSQVTAVAAALPATADPANPSIVSSSWPSRCCCPSSVAWQARSPARRRPSSTRRARAGRCRFPRWPSTAGWALPWSSAASPGCTRRCEPPACRRPRRCARCDRCCHTIAVSGPSMSRTWPSRSVR